MSPEKRLDQLEPLVAEISAQLDRVSAQNRQLVNSMSVVLDTLAQHSDSIRFLLSETSQMKTDIAELKKGQAELIASQAELTASQAELAAGQAELAAGQQNLSQKVDLILQILQKTNGQ